MRIGLRDGIFLWEMIGKSIGVRRAPLHLHPTRPLAREECTGAWEVNVEFSMCECSMRCTEALEVCECSKCEC